MLFVANINRGLLEQCYAWRREHIWAPTKSVCPLNTTTLLTHHGVAPREAVNKRGLSLSR